MRTMATMIVRTVPVPKARPRVTRSGHAYTPDKTAIYEKLLASSWSGGVIMGKHLMATMRFGMPIPKSWSKGRQRMSVGKLHTSKPDLDNLVKAVLDGLNGVAFDDDAKIAAFMAEKIYAVDPFVEITISGGK